MQNELEDLLASKAIAAYVNGSCFTGIAWIMQSEFGLWIVTLSILIFGLLLHTWFFRRTVGCIAESFLKNHLTRKHQEEV